jgi:hypothetical protein
MSTRPSKIENLRKQTMRLGLDELAVILEMHTYELMSSI